MKKLATKSSKKPATKRKQMIVFRDGAGNYYELSRVTFQRGKVTGPRKKEIEKALEDVLEESGYINAPTIPGSIVKAPFAKSQALRYAGFYLKSTKPKR